jgi:hypothetical protein
MIVALIFLVSVVVAILAIYKSPLATWSRVILFFLILLFAALAYILATKTSISPFSLANATRFGSESQVAAILIAIVGAVSGVVGSYFFRLGDQNISWRGFAAPLATAPLVLIPTIKLVEASGEQTPLALLLLFALSYQNGFFWERLLRAAPQ